MFSILWAVMDILIYLLSFVLLLSLIVFVHEYGHFKVARLCGVKVDVFSIGFGKTLLSRRDRHGTMWQVSLLPLGGYVKFFGDQGPASAPSKNVRQEQSQESQIPVSDANGMMTQFPKIKEKEQLGVHLSEDERRVCFHFKPVWARAAVVAAGPVANFLLAIVIFAGLLWGVGKPYSLPIIGSVTEGSAAQEAGFLPGDEVITINGRSIRSFADLRKNVALASDSLLRIAVQREGKTVLLTATPRRHTREDAFGNRIRTGFLGVGLQIPPIIGSIAKNSTAEAAGLQEGDRILRLDAQLVNNFSDIFAYMSGNPEKQVQVVLSRNAQELTTVIVPKAVEITTEEGASTIVGFTGIGYEQLYHRYGPVEAVVAGVGQTWDVLATTLHYLGRLVRGKEDPRMMGGPVKIAQYAGQAAKAGFTPAYAQDIALWTKMTTSILAWLSLGAMISVSIGFLNLLPVPVLDGGHLMYYAYEAVFGRPLSDRIQAFGLRIGVLLLGALMVFVFWNDVSQLLFGMG